MSAPPGTQPVAIVTGASRGLGLALARALAVRGWRLVIDARDGVALERARADLAVHADVAAIAGDVADPRHRDALVAAAGDRVDLLVNNASLLGPSPQPPLRDYPIAILERVYAVNVIAPLALAQLVLPRMDEGATILNVTSDAAVEVYEAGAATARRRPRSSSSRASSPPSTRSCASTRSTPATCARRCTRTRSPARTSPTARRPRRASRDSSRSSRASARADGSSRATSRRSRRDRPRLQAPRAPRGP